MIEPPPLSCDSDSALKALRKVLRARRRAVPMAERKRAALRLATAVERRGWLRPGRRIGLYLPLAEEIDTQPLLDAALQHRCRLFVPRVTDYRRHRMQFLPYDGTLQRGRYGILEPRGGIARSARSLDVIFMPLVGFDARGSRVGMGKGYYDRALAFLHHRRTWRRPLLVGLAFACQQVDALPTRAHDVPLDHIVTEAGSHRFIRPRPFT